MYAVTSIPVVKRTRATFLNAEFGFFGVVVKTRVQTPRLCGAPLRAGVDSLAFFDFRPFRTNCWIVGTELPQKIFLIIVVWKGCEYLTSEPRLVFTSRHDFQPIDESTRNTSTYKPIMT